MKYEIGDLVIDEDQNKGIVCIKWNDGDVCVIENDAAHPNPIVVGHWPLIEKRKPKYKKVYCSQCGKEFGPRDCGYSHCKDHKGVRPIG